MKNYYSILKKAIKYIVTFEKTSVSYYPERERKSKRQIIGENVLYLFRHGSLMKNYYSYGFDVKGVNMEDYFEEDDWASIRNRANGIYGKKLDYTCLVGNKELFELICKTHHLRVAISIGAYRTGGKCYDNERQTIVSLNELVNSHPHLFLKPSTSAKGKGAFAIDKESEGLILNGIQKDFDSIIKELDEVGNEMLIQERLIQNKVLSDIYPHSLNTLRVASVLDGEEVVIIGALLRLGSNGRVVDNSSQGGISVGIGEDGRLNKYGYYFPQFGTKTDKHPDTHVAFESIEIPYYKEVLKLVKDAHRVFKWIKTVGWDIAVLEDGPILIEGNSRYAGTIQLCCGGMRNKMNKYLK